MKCQELCTKPAEVKLIWGYSRHNPPNPHHWRVCREHLKTVGERIERNPDHYLVIQDLNEKQEV